MGIPTLLSTSPASADSELDITSNITSAYDEYMFVFTDIHSGVDGADFQFQTSIDSGSNYNVTVTSTMFRTRHAEGDGTADLSYETGDDIAQGTSFVQLGRNLASGDADESGAGILHLFSPSSTTYVKHFYSRYHAVKDTGTMATTWFGSGYFNTTDDIDAIRFKMHSGNIDYGVIQMYGIA
tara:strand:+ start:2055 stop:2600 length:546 start_codon:yes stop_codon:yes gene_type:complete